MSKHTEEHTKETANEARTPVRRWNAGNAFWGLLFVLVGVLFLLDNLAIIEVNFANIWQLWPVLIIGVGLSMLSLRGWLGIAVSLIATVALLGLVALTVVVDNPWYQHIRNINVQTSTQVADIGPAKKLDVSIKTGAATIELSSHKEQQGVKATQESNGPELKKTIETKNATRYVAFSADPSLGRWFGSSRNDLSVTVMQTIPTALHIDTGATTVSGDLSQIRLTSLSIDTGASSIDLRLGAIEPRQEVAIDTGASNIVLYIPKNTGVKIESSGGLSSTEFDGIDKSTDSTYESAGFDKADKQIVIRADIGVSRFEIRRY